VDGSRRVCSIWRSDFLFYAVELRDRLPVRISPCEMRTSEFPRLAKIIKNQTGRGQSLSNYA
jgi:hypothetical protein